MVIHFSGDQVQAPEQSRMMARLLKNAEFHLLESQNHVLVPSEPIWAICLDEIDRGGGRRWQLGGNAKHLRGDDGIPFRDTLNRLGAGLTLLPMEFAGCHSYVAKHRPEKHYGSLVGGNHAMDWNSLALAWIDYEEQIERTHSPVKEGLLARAALTSGESLLDLGCGSGALSLSSACQVSASGSVIAFDIAEAFVARVRARARDLPHVNPVQGDAQCYDFTAAECDAVISLFGTMFFAEASAAFANIAKALLPGGRIVFAAWAGAQHNPWFSVPGRALVGALPDMPPPDPSAPGSMAFADIDMVTGLLSETGFVQVAAEEVDTHLTPIGTAADITAMMLAIGPFRATVSQFAAEGQEDAAMVALAQTMTEGYSKFATDAGVRVPARVIYYSATRKG